ncbi:MAG TPA: zinc ribbon domain-containing protein [Thermoleophilaceae bacterium]
MAYIVLIIFTGLSAGIVAKIRGNGFWIWFAIGFVLPFFGTVAALLYRRGSEVEKRECPECGNVIAVHDQVCMKCGRDLDWSSDLTLPA